MRWVVRSALVDFAPDWLLVSAGYDAHRDDPLAGMKLESGDYAVMTHVVAGVVAPGRTIYFLEGGYDLAALEASTAATLRGHSGDSESLPGHDDTGESAGWRAALSAATSLS
jgi:acetoin utilization deacetylase AcuC-like enzyme